MKKILLLTATAALLSSVTYAQCYKFKELNQTYIKGASRLTEPRFIKSGDSILTVGKHGHSAPAIYDWDGDGKLDLLVGEFGGGHDANILVFKNTGKNKKPIYDSKPYYAKDKTGAKIYIFGS